MFEFISQNFASIVGYTASIFLLLGYLPQTVHTIRTRKTDDIALPTFLMIGIGGICFMLQGVLHKPAFFSMMIASGSRVKIRGVQMADDRLNPGSPGGPQDSVEFFFVGHNFLMCFLFLRLIRLAAKQEKTQ